MEESTFEPGDNVQLKAGGPQMTITHWDTEGGGWHCAWFEGSKKISDVFPPEALQTYRPRQRVLGVARGMSQPSRRRR